MGRVLGEPKTIRDDQILSRGGSHPQPRLIGFGHAVPCLILEYQAISCKRWHPQSPDFPEVDVLRIGGSRVAGTEYLDPKRGRIHPKPSRDAPNSPDPGRSAPRAFRH
ncbi:hypothetical protein Pan216_45520 [Planctomycetes bacterium Pan216]|uniref:Uncharacterized protein n=1 Tax=Kolteria novifilia TaxID=2527975 RepID=A0A518B9L7_9BACT|nr:hypothetical protein Pan216_45520 [Planctomycetes bacterium Pan216]